MKHYVLFPGLNLLLWTCLPALAGCGSAAYETKFNETLKTLSIETPFRELFEEPVELPEQGLSLRLPRIFDSKTTESYALNSQTLEPRDPLLPLIPIRVQPEFLNLEGYVRTYERTWEFTDAHRHLIRRPIYCYIAIVQNPSETGELKKSIQSQLERAFGGQPEPTFGQKRDNPGVEFSAGDWTSEPISLPTPDGSRINAYKIEAAGQYLIPYYKERGKPTILTEIDVCKFVAYLYSHEATDHAPAADVIVAWFTPYQVAVKIDLDRLAAATIGTVVVSTPVIATQ